MANTLVVNFTFNPPVIKIVGPVKESTIEKLNSVLPSVTSSRRGDRAGQPKFAFKASPTHWTVTLDGQTVAGNVTMVADSGRHRVHVVMGAGKGN